MLVRLYYWNYSDGWGPQILFSRATCWSALGCTLKVWRIQLAIATLSFAAADIMSTYLLKESEMASCITFRYQQLLTECHQCYFTQRELLLSSSVAGSITELSVTHKGDHCSLVRSSCAFLVHVCQDEHQLFYQFFGQPTPLLTWVHFLEIFQPAVYVLLFLQFYLNKCHNSAADWTGYGEWQMTRKLVTTWYSWIRAS